MSLVEVRCVTVTAGAATLLHEVTFDADEGQMIAIVGPNGAGKSTLLSVLAGDLAPSAGVVTMAGRDVRRTSTRDLAGLRSVQPQETHISFPFTVRDVVAMALRARPRGVSRSDHSDAQVIDAALRDADVLHLNDRSITDLSTGERSRVTLARVLAQRTPIVMLDEPTAALDIRHQHQVMAVARRTADEGRLVIAVLHDLNLAAAYADRVLILRNGHLAASGTPEEVFTEDGLSEMFEHPVTVARVDGQIQITPSPRSAAVPV